ncbi:Lysylphosphatidylglycerol synthase TM region [Bifidobacterium sp. DSM 109958]|uniref:Lysylphosphatidylglycerol synthase TM region n=1 Tax=Bifidobacterium moraviense TaxID=2675323 RepID=A0A7Y0HX62_9BIFI|nr:YbhN family protein [Bifidobacterium sp. DSM 109958]NMM99945.1 Lysylphosphatidylglycerol synthase TM region [Bifidobacterium sp. DSM 109958]
MPTNDAQARIHDTPPRRVRDFVDLARLVAALLMAVAVMLACVFMRGLTSGVESDVHQVSALAAWLGDLPTLLLTQAVTLFVLCSVTVQMLWNREWRQTASSLIALMAGYAAAWGVSSLISAVGPEALVRGLWSVAGGENGVLLPDVYAGLGAFLSAAGPRRLRPTVRWGWNALWTTAVVLIVCSTNSLGGVLVSLALGRAVGLAARLAVGTQNKGAWGPAVAHALADVGIETASLTRRDADPHDPNALSANIADDLSVSSRIYDAEAADGARYVVSVLDAQAHTSGYMAQLWQWIKLSGVSVRHDRTVRDAVRHHQTMLLTLRDAGLAAMRPYAICEQGESAILVLDAEPAAVPALRADEADGGDTRLSDDDLTAYLRYLDAAHRRGITHHNIAPECLARMADGTPMICGWQNGDVASSPANVAIDRMQMLTLLAALAGVERAIGAARRVWDDRTLAALVPFVQQVAVPRATRSLPGFGKRMHRDLRDALGALVPQDVTASMPEVTLTRFSVRSFLAIALLVVALLVIVTQLNMEQVIAAMRGANPWMAVLCFLCGTLTWVGSGISLGAFIDRDRRDPVGILMSQAASSFTSVSMPAGVGPAFVNLQYLRHIGYSNSLATAVMSAVLALQAVATVVLVVVIGLFTGSGTFSGTIPTNALVMIGSALVVLVVAAMAIPRLRRVVVDRLLPIVATYARQLADLLTRPRQLAVGTLGALIQTFAFGLAFWSALMAFGWRTNVFETTFVFLLANTLGSAVPTPGGLGAVEAALMAGFGAAGVPSAIALSATLVYRVATYWLRIPLGALAMQWLDRRHLV